MGLLGCPGAGGYNGFIYRLGNNRGRIHTLYARLCISIPKTFLEKKSKKNFPPNKASLKKATKFCAYAQIICREKGILELY